ncbi:hypothetical protein D3C76_958520 [compost metagenome]
MRPACGSGATLVSRKNTEAPRAMAPSTTVATTTARQPPAWVAINPPSTGESMIALSMPMTVMATTGPAFSFHTSRTMLRATTSAAQAPKPWRARPPMNSGMFWANTIQSEAST